VALAAGMRAVAQSADGATLLKQRTLALWVAQNRLAEAQLADAPLSIGSRNGDAAQAGERFVWREIVSGTPNPAFRKIDIVVADASVPAYALARLSGYLGQPARR
jgi:general secretion pathway protein I